MDISNLVIEITRRCNMACSHCLRGEQENNNIDFKYIDSLLSQVNSISSVTFSGGEPSLYTEAIEYFLNVAKRKRIEINEFYIATNGKSITEDFIITCLKMYSYCNEKETCKVDVSNDYFHAEDSNYNTELLSGLAFFNRKFEKEAEYYEGINQGYYLENYGDGRELEENSIYSIDDFNDTAIYLNCLGEIINGCDWSYDNQNEHILCKVDELTNFYNNLEEL